MFEKESKEYANKWLYHVKDLELHHKEDDKPEYIRIEEAYQKGAEYGYNLAHEEIDYLNQHWLDNKELDKEVYEYAKSRNGTEDSRMTDRMLAYRTGYKKGFEECAKARLNVTTISDCPIKDEWHYVKDGDLPKDENDVLVYSGEEWRMCVGRYSPKHKAWEAGCDAIAWKEIVLPELKESE